MLFVTAIDDCPPHLKVMESSFSSRTSSLAGRDRRPSFFGQIEGKQHDVNRVLTEHSSSSGCGCANPMRQPAGSTPSFDCLRLVRIRDVRARRRWVPRLNNRRRAPRGSATSLRARRRPRAPGQAAEVTGRGAAPPFRFEPREWNCWILRTYVRDLAWLRPVPRTDAPSKPSRSSLPGSRRPRARATSRSAMRSRSCSCTRPPAHRRPSRAAVRWLARLALERPGNDDGDLQLAAAALGHLEERPKTAARTLLELMELMRVPRAAESGRSHRCAPLDLPLSPSLTTCEERPRSSGRNRERDRPTEPR